MSLTPLQQRALDFMKAGKSIFLTGAGGCGKSRVTMAFTSWLAQTMSQSKFAITSTTGISAINIGGRTIHSFAGIGYGEAPVDVLLAQIKKRFFIWRKWKRTKVLIIDEISMLDAY